MKKKLIVLSSLVLSSMPVIALAQISVTGASSGNCIIGPGGTLFGVLCRIGQLLNAVVPVLIALGVVYFVWGVITYVIANEEEAKKQGRNRMIMGIIGLAVIIGLWGLVKLLSNTLGVSNSNVNIELPTVPLANPPYQQ